jgi:50S ribosomal protein L16 3-hydroxylase
MNIDQPLALLGGLSPQEFMQQYWQRKPLLIRQAIPAFKPGLSIADIKKLVRRGEVESRLICRDPAGWTMESGPFARLPAASRPNWTVLAQSVDLHDDAIAQLVRQFRFISDARLDDAMISIATDGGGVGPHFDSYDVFLLQGQGQRRWRISSQKDLELEPGLPLKILKNFRAEQDYLLEPGDMLYLPPHIAHDGSAVGDCMTISIGFRAPSLATLARGLLDAAGDQIMALAGNTDGLYAHPPLSGPVLTQTFRDAGVPATSLPARLPDTLIQAARQAVEKIRFDDRLAARFLGQWLTELPPAACFEPADEPLDLCAALPASGCLALDRCTRLMYRDRQLFINGEVAPVAASKPLQKLADERELACTGAAARKLTGVERGVLNDWLSEGWLHYRP